MNEIQKVTVSTFLNNQRISSNDNPENAARTNDGRKLTEIQLNGSLTTYPQVCSLIDALKIIAMGLPMAEGKYDNNVSEMVKRGVGKLSMEDIESSIKKKNVFNKLKKSIVLSRENEESGHAASWGSQEGVLLSRNEAEIILEQIKAANK